LEVSITLLSAKSAVQPGPTEVTLPLAVRAGCADSPAVLLTLRAHVVVPDVVTSVGALEFGTVWNGHCKVRDGGLAWLGMCGLAAWVGGPMSARPAT